MQQRLLIVEDEPAISAMLAYALRRDGYAPVIAANAAAAQALIAERVPDLILLDWMLPGSSGLDLTQRWRREDATRSVPIIMLTARGEEDDRVRGLEAGVDDYVVKPFSTRELLARVRAVLRRAGDGAEDGQLRIGALRLDPATQRVFKDDDSGSVVIAIGPTELRLLQFLMRQRERVHSRAKLLDHVWGGSVHIEERTVDAHVLRLRRALEPHGLEAMVQTVRGAGYRLSALE